MLVASTIEPCARTDPLVLTPKLSSTRPLCPKPELARLSIDSA